MPRLLADENIQAPLVAALREAGHDMVYVAEGASGITDEAVVAMAVEGHRYLLTEDKDFGDLVFRLKRGLPGVILLRLPDVLWETRYRRLITLFPITNSDSRIITSWWARTASVSGPCPEPRPLTLPYPCRNLRPTLPSCGGLVFRTVR